MIITTNAPMLGANTLSGIWGLDSVVIGLQQPKPTQYIFIQNDSSNVPTSPAYVAKIDNTHYEMPAAPHPKYAQYIGVFVWDIPTDTRGGRLGADAVWTTSAPDVVEITKTSSTGQAVINIHQAGTATLTVEWHGLKSTLTITAI